MNGDQRRRGIRRTFDSSEMDYIFLHGLDLRHNQIYLNGIDRGYEVAQSTEEPGVDFVMATQFTKSINLCQSRNPGKPILVHMSTCGEDWNFGMQIHDAIESSRSHVTIVNYTHARSMSSLILQAADWRVMMPNSHFMFHDGSYGDVGTVKQVTSGLDFYNAVSQPTMLKTYSKQMQQKGEMRGKDRSGIEKWLREQMDKKEDVFLTAEEAIRYGFADEIFKGWEHYIHQGTHMPRVPRNAPRPKGKKTKTERR